MSVIRQRGNPMRIVDLEGRCYISVRRSSDNSDIYQESFREPYHKGDNCVSYKPANSTHFPRES